MPNAQQASRQQADSRGHVFMSIKPEHMDKVARGIKNHEFRRYLLPESVHHIWFYVSAPISAIRYVARISHGMKPGEVPEDGGLGNEEFNAGKKQPKFGFAILELWELREPITLQKAREGGLLKGAPQKHTFVPSDLRDRVALENEVRVLRGGKAAKGQDMEGGAEKGLSTS